MQRLIRRKATRRFGTRLVSRTKRVAGRSIAAIPAEAISFLGVAVLIADTGYELYAACETVSDWGKLYGELGLVDERLTTPCTVTLIPLPDCRAFRRFVKIGSVGHESILSL